MQELLKQFDLDEHEAKIYLALLELGPSTVTEVTKKSGVTRTLGYLTLDKLGWKGLVTRVQDAGKKIKYVAENPRNFLQYVKNKKHVWENRLEKAETILPDLMSLYKIEDKPVIRFQEGAHAVMNLFEESLNSKTEILAVLDVESWNKPEFWDWAKKYNRERNKRKIKERILILDTPKGREWIKSYHGSPHTVYRWITREQAKGLLEFGGELNIYENKVVVAMLRKHHMLAIIESAILTNILRSMFNIIWEVAQPVKIKK